MEIPSADQYPVTPVTVECIQQAAATAGVPLDVLKALLLTEGGWPGLAMKNKNGSYDLGPMQINTIWTKEFRQYNVPMSFLRQDGCGNVLAGAWILRGHLEDTGDPWKAAARYHSRNRKYQHRYLRAMLKNIRNAPSLVELVRRINAKIGS